MRRLFRRKRPTAPKPAQRADDLAAIRRTTLPNGLRLWVKPRPGTGTVAILAQFPVGSRHETKENNGISHFLEHMLFTGTRRWDEHEVTEIIRRRGGEANARTAQEDTVYWLHLKADDLALGLDWLAEVLFRPSLATDKFDKERRVIINEKGGHWGRFTDLMEWVEDRGLGWNIFRAVRNRLWPESSLLLPVIGDDRSLHSIDHAALLDFYRQHYLPNNLTMVVVGDVHPDEVQRLVEEYFGELEPGPLPPKPKQPPAPTGGFRVRLRGPSINDQGQLLLGAPIPGLRHPDRHPLLVLAEMMEAALTRDIRFDRGLVYGIDVYPAMYSDVGYFVVYTTAESERFAEIMHAIRVQIERAIRREFDPVAVEEAKSAVRGRALLAMEGSMNEAWWLAEDAMHTADDEPIPDFFAAVEAVGIEDIQRVAEAYLSQASRYEAVHRPGLTPRRAVLPAAITAGLSLTGVSVWLATWIGRRRKRRNRAAGDK